MNNDTVIQVENLAKFYRIGERQSYLTLRDQLARLALSPFTSRKTDPVNEFWALRDVSFEVARGEVVGIIGKNGAGKSTLLKIISRITEPSAGKITLHGSVASLLEVGTGFSPELTGRENIFLNGSILGMSKQEIRKKFDEIVDFSGVEQFLDTPVKRYSSGMYVRLAFAVAAHLDSEILLVDEVLAVGDVEFQKKCLQKMQAITKGGRTILFVSHNLAAIEALCNRGIILETGRVTYSGKSSNAVRHYLEQQKVPSDENLLNRKDRQGDGRVKISGFRILNQQKEIVSSMMSGDNYCFEIDYHKFVSEKLKNVVVGISIYDELNIRVMELRTSFSNANLSLTEQKGKIQCLVNDLPLTLGSYTFSLILTANDIEMHDLLESAYASSVDGGDFFGTGKVGNPDRCKILIRTSWLLG